MDRRKIKFLVGSLIIVVSIAWIGFSSFDESLAYYKTVDELKAMNHNAYGKRLRVAGNVVAGSIARTSRAIKFPLREKGEILHLSNVGKEILPATFKERGPA